MRVERNRERGMADADIGNQEFDGDEDFGITVTEQYHGWRIDKLLSQQREELSRSYIQKLIADGRVLVAGHTVKSGFKVSRGQDIRVFVPEAEELIAQPEDIPLDILYEDEDVILVNKGKDMVVHPAAGHPGGTLVNALLYHCRGQLSAINGVLRPGIVHRIDRNTTGVIVACKNDKAHQSLSAQLKVHSITRKYNALVYGAFDGEGGRIEGAIGRHPLDRKKMAVNEKNGKAAVTNYTVLENFGTRYSHVECRLETGRTHQIRVHMSHIHHPLLGDDVYGPAKDPFRLEGQALHARVLGFIHPSSGKYMEFTAPLPEYFTALVEKLRRM